MAQVRARLDEFTKQSATNGDDGPTVEVSRENIIALLKAISESLKPATEVDIGVFDDGTRMVTDHAALELLDQFIDVLHDLNNGKTDPCLKPASYGPNRSLTTRQRKETEVLMEAVRIVQSWPQDFEQDDR